MKKKVYLETSLFNFYIDESGGDAHIFTLRLFEEIAKGKYEAFTSTYVIEELEKAEEEKRNKMLEIIQRYDITILSERDEVDRMAEIYVANGVIPNKFRTDGLHIAIATVYGLDMIVSMNLRHIVKRKTIKMTTHINILNGYSAVKICSPAEVVEYGKKDPSDRT